MMSLGYRRVALDMTSDFNDVYFTWMYSRLIKSMSGCIGPTHADGNAETGEFLWSQFVSYQMPSEQRMMVTASALVQPK